MKKIKFAEDIYSNASKESINLIVDYIINLVKKNKNLKEKLEYKNLSSSFMRASIGLFYNISYCVYI